MNTSLPHPYNARILRLPSWHAPTPCVSVFPFLKSPQAHLFRFTPFDSACRQPLTTANFPLCTAAFVDLPDISCSLLLRHHLRPPSPPNTSGCSLLRNAAPAVSPLPRDHLEHPAPIAAQPPALAQHQLLLRATASLERQSPVVCSLLPTNPLLYPSLSRKTAHPRCPIASRAAALRSQPQPRCSSTLFNLSLPFNSTPEFSPQHLYKIHQPSLSC